MIRAFAVAALFCAAGTALAGTGDVNNDSKVTAADAVLALKIAGGLLKPTAAQAQAADVNPASIDGAVTLGDAIRITRIALGVDSAIPGTPITASYDFTVTGDSSPVFNLPGGFSVAGTLTDSGGKAFDGFIVFRNTQTHADEGPFALQTVTGAFSALLPPGVYQPIALTHTETQSGNGETGFWEAATSAGSTVTVTGAVTGLVLKRPAVASPSTLTLSFSGPSAPFMATATVTLIDSGLTPATFGWNQVSRDVTITPASIAVPDATYDVRAGSQYALSSGAFEKLTIWYDQALSVTGPLAKTLAFPRLYELHGAITALGGSPPMDVYMQSQPTTAVDVTAAYVTVDANFGSYLMAVQPGAQLIRIGLTSPFAETDVSYMLPYTMPASNTTKNITTPALPAFRTISGTVRTPTGAALVGATVTAVQQVGTVPAGGQFAFAATTTTVANGLFTMRLPNGIYTVTVTPA